MNKQSYLKREKEFLKLKELSNSDKYRLNFHLMGESGWINDPNGLVQFKGVNHIYYQYSPFNANGDVKLWGHYTTKDWINYKSFDPFIFADIAEDKDGVYSGSAYNMGYEIVYYYTGNVEDKNDYREQNTIMIRSKDGFSYDKKQVIFKNEDYPQDLSKHVRDPKLFKFKEDYYLILGARSKNDRALALIYKKESNKWIYHMRISLDEKYGYMLECPDLINIDGKWFLIGCPQGMKKEGIKYANTYQLGYFALNLDLDKKEYEIKGFEELDNGFDIYASQSFLDEKNRRILIAWMGMFGAKYDNKPSLKYMWQHALSIPRELWALDNKLYQKPLKELENLREEKQEIEANTFKLDKDCFELIFKAQDIKKFNFEFSDMKLNFEKNIFSLSFGKSGRGRDKRAVYLEKLDEIRMFVDKSSVELFLNKGEKTFTSRFYRDFNENIFSYLADKKLSTTLYYLSKFNYD